LDSHRIQEQPFQDRAEVHRSEGVLLDGIPSQCTRTETNQALLTEILKILNRGGDLQPIVAETLQLIRTVAEFDAVGLRLRKEDDCPYFEHNGFSEAFLQEENFLCKRGGDGRVVRNADGVPILECTCGLVLCGRTDPSMPCFTKGGSFWTNRSSDLLALSPEQDPRTSPRNRCIHDGYQSVGLFPVRAGTAIVGLLQLNDRRVGRFSPELISFYETLAQNLGLAFQRAAAEDALRQSRADLERAQEVGQIGSWRLDVRRNILTWSDETYRIFGIPLKAPLTYESFLGAVHPDDRQYVDTQWIAAMAGAPYSIEHRIIVGGQIKWVREKAYLEFDEAKDLLGGFGIVQDITERKSAEDGLCESEERFRLFMDNSPTIAWIKDEHGQRVYINKTLEERFGVRLEEWRGKTDDELWPASMADKFRKSDLEVLAAGRTIRFTDEIIDPNGRRSYWDKSKFPFSDSAGHRFVAGVGLEITERKQAEDALQESEERFRNIADNSPVMIWVTRPDGYCTYLNRVWCEFTGQSPEEGLGFGWLDAVHPDDAKAVRDDFFSTTHACTAFRTEYRLRRGDGQYRWCIDSAAPRFGLRDEFLGYVGSVIDITERKQAEEELRRVNENLENTISERTAKLAATNKELEEKAEQLRLLAGELTMTEQRERKHLSKVLHDGLQQYLVAAKLQLGGLLGPSLDLTTQNIAADVENLLGEALEVSRSLAVDLSPPILHDAGLVVALEWLSRWMLEKHQFTVELVSHVDAPVLTEDVKLLLFESVRELLLNAVKHAEADSATVDLKQNECQLQIAVSDNGKGFDPKTIPPMGTSSGGFGLFSIRERIALIGGRFNIDSSPGKGTQVTLTAPLVIDVMPISKDLHQRTYGKTEILSQPDGKVRILLTDDHAIMREGLARLLGQEGDFEVIGQASNGQEAVEMATALHPHLILMDISMPKMNGIDATRIIHQQHPFIRIIGLSLYADEERAREMLDAGAVAYLTKSDPAAELKAVIRASMGEENFKKRHSP
jgi:PAS domain S-box-containing protein